MTFDRFVASLLLAGIGLLACLMPAHNDTWWHLRAGYEMIAARSVMLTDTFSHTVTGGFWPNYEWLGEIVLAAAHRAGGMPLATAVCAAAVTGGAVFVYASMPRGGLLPPLMLAAIAAGATHTWSLRPQAFSLLLLGLTIWLTSTRRWRWLPPVFLAWANLHGAVAYGAVVVAGTMGGWLWHERRIPRTLAVCAALSAAATFLTPLGSAYWFEIAESIARSRINDIAEWRRPDLPPAHPVFWTMAAALPIAAWSRRANPMSPEARGLLCSALLLLPLASLTLRNITAFLMAAAPAMAALFPYERRPPRESRPQRAMNAALAGTAIAVVAAVAAFTWRSPPPRMDWAPMSAGAARAIDGCRPRLYNRYVDGGPIIYFAPSQKVLLDSRQDPYPVTLVQQQFEIEATGDYAAFFDRHALNCAAVPPDSSLVRRLEGDGWIRRFADSRWVVLERPPP